ncbi:MULTISPECIES: PLP-dependent aminotransferase family protein [unclassified Enterococcus]|uniref:aminotransferase-like domain-containing protein n=1 Tax=unclassified Enterococcus TaxID=2608891 RepID=UPI001A9AADF1|nr:PLP-dependent aminotransferase family protein [Enterococcus sp. DIV1271a]MBO1298763.1 PLP-dependent aminotransferase family protein [Enterococcus sp. DIV1271a]
MWTKVNKNKGSAYQQVMDQIVKKIESGQLQPGDKLPSERLFADFFGVNRTTVVHALDELKGLGILESRRGSGRFISSLTWGDFSEPRIDWRQLISARYGKIVDTYGEKVKEASRKSDFLDLYSSEMPVDVLPNVEMPNYTLEGIIKEEQAVSVFGYQPLMAQIRERLVKTNGFSFKKSQLLVTGGGQQAIFLILQTILSVGDAIAVESPTFFYGLPLFKALGTRLFGIPMDEHGIDLDRLEEAILKHKIKAVLVNPNFQNPTGTVMSAERRQHLVVLCRKYKLPIIEDDVFSDLAFSPETQAAISPIHAIDPENVLYVGSLSRLLGETTKIGWIVGPAILIQRLSEAQKMMDVSLSIFTQMAATAVFDSSFEQNMTSLRQRLETNSQLIREWIDSQDFFQLAPLSGGYYAWLTWNGGKMTKALAERLLREGVGVAPGYLFGEEKGLRINYSRLERQHLPLFIAQMDKLRRWLEEEGH